MYRSFFKRVLDILIAGTALIVLSPLMLIVAVLIYAEDRGKIFFRQKRVGMNGSEFEFVKFRSMPEGSRNVPSTQAIAIPVTRIGRIIRRTNMDELPQLLAVLRGDMSIIGPRPAIPAQENLFALRKANGAISCLPGMTGLAQVNAYDGMPEAEKAQFDGEYCQNLTFANDMRIIFKTFRYFTRKPPVY